MLDPLPLIESLPHLWSEIALIVGVVLTQLLALSPTSSPAFIRGIAGLTPLLAFGASYATPFEPAILAGGLFRADPAAVFIVRVLTVVTLIGLPWTLRGPNLGAADLAHRAVPILLLALGASLAARAADILSLFLSLSITTLAATVARHSLTAAPSTASPTRSVVAADGGHSGNTIDGGLSGGAIAAGLAMIGGAGLLARTGETSFAAIGVSLATIPAFAPSLFLAASLVVLSLSACLPAPPLGRLATEQIESSPAFLAALLTNLLPAGGFLLLYRFVGTALSSATDPETWAPLPATPWPLPLGLAAAAALIAGTTAAFRAATPHQMMARLSIVHSGWLLIGVATGTAAGGRGALIEIITWIPASLGVAKVLEESSRRGATTGAQRMALIIFLLSLAGAPLTIGFVGRFEIMRAAVSGTTWWLAAAGALQLAVLPAALLKLHAGMSSAGRIAPIPGGDTARLSWTTLILLAATLAGGLGFRPLLQFVLDALPLPS